MKFSSAREIEQICWSMKMADYDRSTNRALIDNLADGFPPYSANEERKNAVNVNVNDLTLTRLSHDARLQLYQAFNKPGNFFTLRTDRGTSSKRLERGITVTKNLNRMLKRSNPYYHCMTAQFAQMVQHGIGPSSFVNKNRWGPTAVAIGDLMIPSRTLTSFENLPYYAVHKRFSAHELRCLTRNSNRNPGWNMAVVNSAIRWADKEASKQYATSGTAWNEVWSPEARQQRIKEGGGLYASDLVPTIDCWDFYYLDDAGGHEGWRRKIVLDAEGGYKGWTDRWGRGEKGLASDKNLIGNRNQYLYDAGDRVCADSIDEILHCQFADLSAVAPFRYHSVRGLGFMVYAAAHLQNRMRCKFSESVFENLNQYFRVQSLDEAQRVLKIELVSQGLIEEGVSFVRKEERHVPDHQLVAMGMNEIKQVIQENSSSHVQNQNFSRDRVEKTRYQVSAEVNAMMTLVSAALQQAYRYQETQYREIARRFLSGCDDPDVRQFRAKCLGEGVPESLLVPDAWDVQAERIMGSGNKTLEMTIAQQLMEWRAAYPPEGQQQILRMATLAVLDDASMTDALVPSNPGVSNDRHDAMVAFGSMMAGGVVEWTKEQNLIEIVQVLISELGVAVQKTLRGGQVPSLERVKGMDNVSMHIAMLIVQIGADPNQKQLAQRLADVSGRLSNEIKGFRQRAEEAAQAGGNGEMAEQQAKIQAIQMQAEAKAENTRMSHAQRTAQRAAQDELARQQKIENHRLDMAIRAREAQADIAADDAKLAAEIQRQRQMPDQDEDAE